MKERVQCCVIGCRRTRERTLPWNEWMCARHLAMASTKTKQRHRFIKRYIRRMEHGKLKHLREWWKYPAGSPQRLRSIAIWQLEKQLWANIKQEATDRTVGI